MGGTGHAGTVQSQELGGGGHSPQAFPCRLSAFTHLLCSALSLSSSWSTGSNTTKFTFSAKVFRSASKSGDSLALATTARREAYQVGVGFVNQKALLMLACIPAVRPNGQNRQGPSGSAGRNAHGALLEG